MRTSIPRFEFPGLHGTPAICGLERIDLSDGRTVVIATELADNLGVSVTNFAEGLAPIVCRVHGIDPRKLIWIEHYPSDPCPVCGGSGRKSQDLGCRACDGKGKRREAPTYDLVTFLIDDRGPWMMLYGPRWRPMKEQDWQDIGLDPAMLSI